MKNIKQLQIAHCFNRLLPGDYVKFKDISKPYLIVGQLMNYANGRISQSSEGFNWNFIANLSPSQIERFGIPLKNIKDYYNKYSYFLRVLENIKTPSYPSWIANIPSFQEFDLFKIEKIIKGPNRPNLINRDLSFNILN